MSPSIKFEAFSFEIATTKTDWHDRPYEDQIMKKVTVETFGVSYDEPIKA